MRELDKITVALGKMFAGMCEVILHDLRDPDHSIRAIENPLSGRQVGDSTTELGLARIQDPSYSEVIQNYANRFPDGRPSKSTSIGIKNAQGRYVAALCLNLDISILSPVARALSKLAATDVDDSMHPTEVLRDRTQRALREVIEAAAADRSLAPRSLPRDVKREIVRNLYRDGYFEPRNAAQVIADILGISRASVYTYIK